MVPAAFQTHAKEFPAQRHSVSDIKKRRFWHKDRVFLLLKQNCSLDRKGASMHAHFQLMPD